MAGRIDDGREGARCLRSGDERDGVEEDKDRAEDLNRHRQERWRQSLGGVRKSWLLAWPPWAVSGGLSRVPMGVGGKLSERWAGNGEIGGGKRETGPGLPPGREMYNMEQTKTQKPTYPAKILGLSGEDSSPTPSITSIPSIIALTLYLSLCQAKQSAIRRSLIPRSRIAPLHNGQCHRQPIHTAASNLNVITGHRHLGQPSHESRCWPGGCFWSSRKERHKQREMEGSGQPNEPQRIGK